ncbi:TPA: cholesterol oxidase substrate-binding domain-containing protein, partial [Burkholderia contaminans]
MSHDFRDEPAPRRAFLADMAKLAAAGIVTGWTPLYQVAAHARTPGDTPPGFPADIPLYKQAFLNWSGEIAVQDVWTAAPR